jgi:prepilin signal peptidase PulO-like enzyme (type II secretory pathway)
VAASELIIPALFGSLVGLAAGEASRVLLAGRSSRLPDRFSWLLTAGGALAVALHPAAREDLFRLAAVLALVGTLLFVLASDVRERAVYPAVVYPGVALMVAIAPLLGISVIDAVFGAAAAGGLFAGFYLLARLRYGPGALGAGDISAAALLGAAVGLSRLFPALALVGAIGVAMALAVGLRARSLRATFPYAPALCLAALATILIRTP